MHVLRPYMTLQYLDVVPRVLAERKLARQVQSRNRLEHRNGGGGDSKSVRAEFRKVQGGFRH